MGLRRGEYDQNPFLCLEVFSSAQHFQALLDMYANTVHNGSSKVPR